MHNTIARLTSVALIALILSACSSGGGGDGGGGGDTADARPVLPPQADGIRITGTVVKGPLVGAMVGFLPIDAYGEVSGPPVATATTDANGSFSATIPADSGDLLIRTGGGEYVDEADRATVPRSIMLGPGEGLESILPAGQTSATVSILTQAVLDKARRETRGGTFMQQFAANRRQAADVFGFDIISTAPANPVAPDPGAPIEQRQYAMVLGGLANLLNRVTVDVGLAAPNIDTIAAVTADLSDGLVDGMVDGVQVMAAGVAISAFSLDDEIDRFRNNNIDSYSSIPPVTIDDFSQVAVPLNEQPVGRADSYDLPVGETLTIAPPGVLGNDTDADGNPLTAELDSPPVNASNFSFSPDGAFSYTHDGTGATVDGFSYVVSDGLAESGPVAVTLSVLNSRPDAANDMASVAEGGLLSAPSVLLNDTDADGDPLTAILADSPANGLLLLNPDGTFEYTHDGSETISDQFTYVANDGSDDSLPAAVNITITPVNDIPTTLNLGNNQVEEAQPPATPVGTFSTVDADAGDTHQYSLVAGAGDTDNARFTIVGSQLQTAAVLNFEAATNCATSASTCAIRVETNDGNGGRFEETFVIDIVDVNDNPTDIVLDSADVDEDSPAGTTVGTFTTVDEDVTDTHSYRLVAGAGDTGNASFAIAGDQLQTAAEFDFDQQASFSIRVQSEDGAGGMFAGAFVVSVNRLDNLPNAVDDGGIGFRTSQDVSFTTANVLDNDDLGDQPTVILSFDAISTAGGAVVEAGSGLFTYTPPPQFVGDDTFSYTIIDDDADTSTATVTIAVTVNQPPTDIALNGNEVIEGLPPGTLVGIFTTTDPDAADTHLYSLVAGTGSDDNASFQIVGDQLQTATVLDSMTSPLSVRVETDDQNGGTFEKVFTIIVEPTGTNLCPVALILDGNTVDEGLPTGTRIGSFITIDPNPDDTHTYSLVPGMGGDDNANFEIDGDSLVTAVVFDAELIQTQSIRVQTVDQSGCTLEQIVTIFINNLPNAVDDGGVGFSTSQDVSFTTANVLDNDDLGDQPTVILSFDAISTAGGAVVEAGSGFFTYTPPPQFIGDDTFSYTIIDDGADTSTATVTIAVSVNQPPTDIALNGNEVIEGLPSGTLVGIFTTTDPDASDTHLYSLVAGTGSDDNASFQIVADQLQTATVLDSMTSPLSVRIETDDQNGGTFEKVFTIIVEPTGTNLCPVALILDGNTVNEGLPTGTRIGSFITIDPNPDDTHTYSLVPGMGGDDNANFEIDGDSLVTAVVFDAELIQTQSIRVQTVDQSGCTLEQIVTIFINNLPNAVDDGGDGFITDQEVTFTTADVLANDDLGDQPTVILGFDAVSTAGGTVVEAGSGLFTYTPPPQFIGDDTFSYTIIDDDADTSTATVTITVNAPPNARIWINPLGGDWSNPDNWSPVGVPEPNDIVVIDMADADPIVTLSGVEADIERIKCTDTLFILSDSSLTLNRESSISCTVTLADDASLTLDGPISISGTVTLADNAWLTVHGPTSMSGTLTLAEGASLAADGNEASLVVDSLNGLDNASLYALAGGSIDISIEMGNSDCGGDLLSRTLTDSTWYADGNSSLISLPNLVCHQVGIPGLDSGAELHIEARNGGVIDMPNLHSLSVVDGDGISHLSSDIDVFVTGIGSEVQMPLLTTFVDADPAGSKDGTSALEAFDHGVINVPMLTAPDQVSISFDGVSVVTVEQLTALTNGVLTLIEASAAFPNLVDLTGSCVVFNVRSSADLSSVTMFDDGAAEANKGSVLVLPNVTSYQFEVNNFGSEPRWRADGIDSRLSFPGLGDVQVGLPGSGTGSQLYIEATNSGVVTFPGLVNLTANDSGDAQTRDIDVVADGAGSVVELPVLSTFFDLDPNTASIIGQFNSGIVNYPPTLATQNVIILP